MSCMLTNVCALASNDPLNSRIDVIQDVDSVTGIINQSIKISGTADTELKNTILTVGIVGSDLDSDNVQNYKVVKQLIIGNDGRYSITIPFQSGGSFVVRLGNEKISQPVQVDLSTASADTINTFMTGIKSSYDKTKLNSEILSKGDELGFDLTIYKRLSNAKQEEICDAVLDDAKTLPIQEIKEFFNNKCSIISVSDQTDKDIVLDSVNYYIDKYSFGNDKEYKVFSDGNTELKNYVAQNVGKKTMSTHSEIKNTLYEFTVLYDLYDIEVNSQMVNKIDAHSFYITNAEYSAFSSLTLAQKTNVATYLANNKAIDMNDFNTKLGYAIVNYQALFPQSQPDRPSSSPGVSGGVSGGSSVSLPTTSSPSVPGNNPVQVTVNFSDLKDAQWAEEAILYLLDKKVVNGKEIGKFYPNDNVTRAEFVKMAMLAFELSADNSVKKSFNDVPNTHWAFEYVNIASSRGLVNGISQNEFGVSNNMTREDMATLGYRILSYFGGITGGQSLENKFTDFASFSDYASNAILMLNNYEYINGYPDGSFKPKDNVTRAEAAQFIYNLVKE